MRDELTTYEWCRRTGGALTVGQRRTLLRRSLRAYAEHGVGLAQLALGRRATGPVTLPVAPDSSLTRAALELAADQGPDIEGHGWRTWLFGGALAAADGVTLDPELLHVGSLVHDAGMAAAVVGEDFTLRGAEIAVAAFDEAGRPLDEPRATTLRDGIVAHVTAGVRVEDSALGAYIQAGALLDLAGIRLVDLPATVVDQVYAAHPAGTVRATILRVLEAERRAVPAGRFAQLHRLGFPLAVRTAPSLRGRS